MSSKKNIIPSLPYSDWFGKGNTKEDIEEVIKTEGKPNKIFIERYMACLVYDDKVIITGYDGNEYIHYFEFNEVIN